MKDTNARDYALERLQEIVRWQRMTKPHDLDEEDIETLSKTYGYSKEEVKRVSDDAEDLERTNLKRIRREIDRFKKGEQVRGPRLDRNDPEFDRVSKGKNKGQRDGEICTFRIREKRDKSDKRFFEIVHSVHVTSTVGSGHWASDQFYYHRKLGIRHGWQDKVVR